VTPEDLSHAADVLRDAEHVAIACHVNPDADALGSMLGLAQHLVPRGTAVTCSYPNQPQRLPGWSEMLPGLDLLVPPDRFPTAPAVMVTCDCASFDRLGVLGPAANAAAELIWIDHHRSNDGSGTIRLVDPDASSTCEVVTRLIDRIGGELTDASALCLYAGLVTDVVAALIVGLSRAIGETVVVLVVAGGTGGSQFTVNPLGPGQTATGAMASLAIGSDQVRGAGPAFQSLFFLGLLLFFVTFALNVVSERFVRKVRKRY
jgi:bifunctional oligoribonuclease and PAP phosphatase NrnA